MVNDSIDSNQILWVRPQASPWLGLWWSQLLWSVSPAHLWGPSTLLHQDHSVLLSLWFTWVQYLLVSLSHYASLLRLSCLIWLYSFTHPPQSIYQSHLCVYCVSTKLRLSSGSGPDFIHCCICNSLNGAPTVDWVEWVTRGWRDSAVGGVLTCTGQMQVPSLEMHLVLKPGMSAAHDQVWLTVITPFTKNCQERRLWWVQNRTPAHLADGISLAACCDLNVVLATRDISMNSFSSGKLFQ